MSGARSGSTARPRSSSNGLRLDGPWDYEDLVEAIDAAVAAA